MFKKIFSLSGLVVFLILISSAGIIYKNSVLGVPLTPDHERNMWLVEARVSYLARGAPSMVAIALPGVGDRNKENGQQISLGYGFSKEKEKGLPVGIWSARSPKGKQLLYYRTVIDSSKLRHEFIQAKSRPVPKITEISNTITDEASSTGGSRSVALGVIYRDAKKRSADDATYVTRIQELISENSDEDAFLLLKRYYESKYENEWQRTLVIALLKQARIPAKRAVGVKLIEDNASREPIKLVQYFDRPEGVWRVIHPHGGSLNNILVWSLSENLLEVSGGQDSLIQFTAVKERAPTEVADRMADSPWWVATISALPASERAPFRYAALIPLGVLAVVLLRNLVGLATLGTFMPVLLGLAFLELPMVPALIMLSSMLFGGLVFRAVLSKFNLLVVPRVAACVVIVTLFMMGVSLLSYKLGAVEGLRVTVFPMIVLAWTIERMSLIWDEDGAFSALYQVTGSLIAALAAFGMMKIEVLQYWVEFFPEILLILLAIILLLGRYTGYRLFELFRFKNAAQMEAK
ncbi:MAG: UUP1 family membrane protein [Rubritalea sp.]